MHRMAITPEDRVSRRPARPRNTAAGCPDRQPVNQQHHRDSRPATAPVLVPAPQPVQPEDPPAPTTTGPDHRTVEWDGVRCEWTWPDYHTQRAEIINAEPQPGAVWVSIKAGAAHPQPSDPG
jgi:hypothetical protein